MHPAGTGTPPAASCSTVACFEEAVAKNFRPEAATFPPEARAAETLSTKIPSVSGAMISVQSWAAASRQSREASWPGGTMTNRGPRVPVGRGSGAEASANRVRLSVWHFAASATSAMSIARPSPAIAAAVAGSTVPSRPLA